MPKKTPGNGSSDAGARAEPRLRVVLKVRKGRKARLREQKRNQEAQEQKQQRHARAGKKKMMMKKKNGKEALEQQSAHDRSTSAGSGGGDGGGGGTTGGNGVAVITRRAADGVEVVQTPGVSKPSQQQQKKMFKTRINIDAVVRGVSNVSSRSIGIQQSSRGSAGSPNFDEKQMAAHRNRLAGGQFRWLNEQLYTSSGSDALRLFQERPELFAAYHEGFEAQVSSWPVNPLDAMIDAALSLPDGAVLVDFGCGTARLAATIDERGRLAASSLDCSRDGVALPSGLVVYSFDLHGDNKYITVADSASVPVTDRSVDLAVFCLSLMGRNYVDFLCESHRVLKPGGILRIAEVRSRFVLETSAVGAASPSSMSQASDEDGLRAFVSAVKSLGFELISEDTSNRMFVSWEFQRKQHGRSKRSDKVTAPLLRACQYKRR